MIRTIALLGLTACLSFGAAAETIVHYREGQRVDPNQVAQILEATSSRAIRTRSIRLLDDAPTPGVMNVAASAAETRAPAQPAEAAPSGLSLPVQFEFDSAAIRPEAREQLDALAAGIKMLPADTKVAIEGHTDASGTAEYNDRLSYRRAVAVKIYLVQAHGIPAERLKASGLGKHEPISGMDPYAGENRRVQFRGG